MSLGNLEVEWVTSAAVSLQTSGTLLVAICSPYTREPQLVVT